MRVQQHPFIEEVMPFDEVPEDRATALELVSYRMRRECDDKDDLGLRALADAPEWLSRAYWRRLRAA